MKKRSFEKTDLLNAPLWRIALNIGLPLLLTQLAFVFLSSVANDIYGDKLGKTVFLVTGVVSMVLALFNNAYGSVDAAIWIRTASVFAGEERGEINAAAMNAVYSAVISAVGFSILMVVLRSPLFRMAAVPAAVEWEASLYYYSTAAAIPLFSASAVLNRMITATASKGVVLLENLLFVCRLPLVAVLFLSLIPLGYNGFLWGPLLFSALHMTLQVCLLRRYGIFVNVKKEHCRIDWRGIFNDLRYGGWLYLQLLLCTVSELFISTQSNRLLDMDVIAAVSVVLPLTSVFSAVSGVCGTIIPQNYAAGKYARVKRLMHVSIAVAVGYGLLCILFHILAGEWYFSTLFEDPTMIALGREYWFWYGLCTLPLGLISIIRLFFDSIGMAKISLLSGIGEVVGRVVCAFVLIPLYGNVGRFVAPLCGWGLGGLLMIVMFFALHKKIFPSTEGDA